jgi:hypothetical protein
VAYSPSPWKAEAGRLQIQGQTGYIGRPVSKKIHTYNVLMIFW